MNRRAVRNLWRRYTIALGLFAALAVATLLGLQPINEQLHRAEIAINISGRQRMLSQRIALLTLEQAIDAGARDADSLHQLDEALNAFATANETLARSNLPRTGVAKTALQAIYYQSPKSLASRSRAFVSAVDRLKTSQRVPIPDARRVAEIAKTELLPLLNDATAAYEARAHTLTRHVQSIELLAAFAVLLLILLEAGVIFWPAQRVAYAAMDDLESVIEVLRRRERDLGEAARLSRLAEDMASVGHWRIDAQTRVITWSPQVFAIHGLDPSQREPDLQGALSAYHPDDRQMVHRCFRDAMVKGHGFDFELRLIRADGELRRVVARGVTEFDPSGAATAVVGVFMDVTDARRAEAAVRESEARYRLLAENTSDMIVTSTLEGRTIYVSPSATKLTGYDIDQITGVRTLDFVHPDDGAPMIEAFRALIAGRPPERLRWRCRHKAGHWVWFESMPALASDPETGALIGFIDVVRDITHNHDIEETVAKSEALYKILAENALDIVSQTACDGKFTYISPSIYDISGYEPSEIIGRTVMKYIHPDDRQRVAMNFQNTIQGNCEESLIEYRLTHKRGHTIWLEARPRAAKDPDTGRVVGVTDLVRDVSERKKLESSLRTAKAEAEAAAVAKSEFLANMSHELRTPLTSIQGFSRLLIDQPDLNILSRHYTDRIVTAGDGLMRIINDLLDFSKLEAGQMPLDLTPGSVIEITRDVLDLLSSPADIKNISRILDIEENFPKFLTIDKLRIRQILLNLVGNAIKFTKSGEIKISLAYDPVASLLTCAVTDTGLGVSEDQLNRLFKRFSQVDGSTTRHHGGTGLGLAICKGLVDMMGGKIGVQSVAGKGSTFWFEIPATPTTLPSQIQHGMGDQLDGVRVLVVDDQDGTRELVSALLRPCGAELSEASNGQEAVDISALSPFDVILMDLRMPVLDGIGAVAAIRSGRGPNCNIPIVAFSADVGSETLSDLRALGFDGQIAKPLDPLQLITTLASLVFSDQLPMDLLGEQYGT